MFQTFICPLRNLHSTVSFSGATNIISLVDSPEVNVVRPKIVLPSKHLRLNFEDDFTSPQEWHAESILWFAQNKVEPGESVVVHCHAGVSRSTAAGLALWVLNNGLKKEEAIKWINQERPIACPNVKLAEHFDKLLNANGKFVDITETVVEQFLIKKFD